MTDQASQTSLLDLFTARLTAVGGHVHTAPDAASAAQAIRTIGSGGGTVWISDDIRQRAPALIAAIEQQGYEPRVPANPGEVRDQPLGLAIAEATIAETGTSILAEPRVESRSVTLMTETLVVVCDSARLLPSLDEAATVLREISSSGTSYATFVTGPSRTADIERQLTVGVQGPGEFHVILIDSLG
jgi:L-lactate dehydrogenase complex protein LldG